MIETLQTVEKPLPGLSAGEAAALPYRVMVVDDSSVVRGLITRAIEDHSLIQVVASAADGAAAINALERTPVDVIILDIEMPVMDGLTALPKLLAVDPAVKIIVASTLSLRNAETSIRALNLGAADYLPKPSSVKELTTARAFKDELIEKILELGVVARKAGVRQPNRAPAPHQASVSHAVLPRRPAAVKQISLRDAPGQTPDIIMIGSSTGGPQALFSTIKDMGRLPQPVMITQHMPPSFTTILAEQIGKHCNVICVEAKDGMILEGGVYYIAPGDHHMLVQNKSGKPAIVLTQDAHENFCRPAVDPMLRSAASVYGRKILAAILTGMGQDGWKGSEVVVGAGGAVVAQDEATSVVWGMPGAVAQAGLCSAVLPIGEIGAYIRKIARGGMA